MNLDSDSVNVLGMHVCKCVHDKLSFNVYKVDITCGYGHY